jgi:hypothetical protein
MSLSCLENRTDSRWPLHGKGYAFVTVRWLRYWHEITELSDNCGGAQKRESGAYGIRTRDLLNAIEALYQLS